MNERDKELANQVTWYADVTLTELSRFADLIRADEREACAKLIEAYPEWLGVNAKQDISAAIRARGNA